MKLLYCIPALHNAGGMERVLTEKVNYFAKLPNFEITIVTTDHLNRPVRFFLDSAVRVVHLDIDFNAHNNYNLVKKYFSHKKKINVYKKGLMKLISELEIDICISLCGKEIDFLDTLNIDCKKIAEIHFGMNVRTQFLTSRHSGLIWMALGKIRTHQLQKSVNGLDRLVVLTKTDKEQWEKKCSNVIQILNPNPLTNNTFSLLNNKRAISVGRLDPQKGYDILIVAWSLVIKKHSDWVLNIYGHGDSKQMLKERIMTFGLGDNVKLCGLATNMVDCYIDSSIYLMSSRYEGLPMVLIEAMSCGLPVVSFDCECGPREIISDAVDGFLVEPNDIQALADKICVLIENENLRTEMGKNAIAKSKRFSIDQIMPQWLTLFEELVN